ACDARPDVRRERRVLATDAAPGRTRAVGRRSARRAGQRARSGRAAAAGVQGHGDGAPEGRTVGPQRAGSDGRPGHRRACGSALSAAGAAYCDLSWILSPVRSMASPVFSTPVPMAWPVFLAPRLTALP